ncbi:DNA replication/repair protein RecF [Lichenicoccus roseus]|uniref:DNA replication and repair protein RecF n=1 Tax=Lichenicoccus roseus TaxID=2683649 RepID=A0A5R9JE92_9PROT|nr:DNA replication/repair protein RecF [Lichenicoccus roseus]TLU73951.1 DNA replication/repair protein RecF [Lichenicoccus roseus]
MLSLSRLTLTDYRNYQQLVWRPDQAGTDGRVSVLTGANGSGKTNLLEALSMLVPGRGLRGARLADVQRLGAAGWAVAARLAQDGEAFEIGTGLTTEAGVAGGATVGASSGGRRVFRLDGEPARNRAAVAERLCAVWLTPQMDRLFIEGPSGRRRFLDRLVLALEPEHAREVAAHDEAMQGRNRLLQNPRTDPAWLAAQESSMARHAVAVCAARRSLVGRLNGAPQDAPETGFPAATLELACEITTQLMAHPALVVEDWLRDQLGRRRASDAAAGGASLGGHRADLLLSDRATARPASLGSTGQQKALLIGILLAHAALIAEVRGEAPLLLLDEPLVHLDTTRREALFAALLRLPAPALLTGTDPEPFAPLRGQAGFWRAGEGKLRPDSAFGSEYPGPPAAERV